MTTVERPSTRAGRVDLTWRPSKLRKLDRLRHVIVTRVLPRTLLGGPKGDCLVWQGATTGAGSGRPAIKIEGQTLYIARVVLAVKLGRGLKPGKVAAHECDFPLCVNEDHLEEATEGKNLRDAWRRSRRTKPSTLVYL